MKKIAENGTINEKSGKKLLKKLFIYLEFSKLPYVQPRTEQIAKKIHHVQSRLRKISKIWKAQTIIPFE